MSVIKLRCIDQTLTFTNLPIAATGGAGGDSVEFTFCSLWDGFTKTAFFFTEDDVYEEPIDRATGVCAIPFDVLAEGGKVRIGVFGVNTAMVCRSSVSAEYTVVDGVLTAVYAPSAQGGFVRYDIAQSLTEEQKQTARDNIGAKSEPEIAEIVKSHYKAIEDYLFYTELSYLEGDKKAYILTDYIPNCNTRIVARAYYNLTSATATLFGSNTSTSKNRFEVGCNSSAKYLLSYGTTTKAATIAEISEMFDIDINRNELYINGELIASLDYSEWQGEYPLAVFGRNSAGTVNYLAATGAQIEYLKIYDNDVLVHDFIPRKHLILGCGLYDRITEKFYGNVASSGEFTGA